MNTMYLKSGINNWWEGKDVAKYNADCFTLQQIMCNMVNFLISDDDLSERYRGSGDELIENITERISQVSLNKPSKTKTIGMIHLGAGLRKMKIGDITADNLPSVVLQANYIVPIHEKPGIREIFLPLRLKRSYILSLFRDENGAMGCNRMFSHKTIVINPDNVRAQIKKTITYNADGKPATKKDWIGQATLNKINRQGGVFVLSKCRDQEGIDPGDGYDDIKFTDAQKARLSTYVMDMFADGADTVLIYPTKKVAKKSQLFREYKIEMPDETPRQCAYRRRGNQLNINANFWIPVVPEDYYLIDDEYGTRLLPYVSDFQSMILFLLFILIVSYVIMIYFIIIMLLLNYILVYHHYIMQFYLYTMIYYNFIILLCHYILLLYHYTMLFHYYLMIFCLYTMILLKFIIPLSIYTKS